MDPHTKHQICPSWSDLPLQTKGFVIIAVPFGALFAGLICFYLIGKAERRQEIWLDQAFQARSELGQLLNHLVDAETGMRGYMLTGREEFLEPYHAGLKVLPDSFSRISALIEDNPDQVAQLHKAQLIAHEDIERITSLVSNAADLPGFHSPKTTQMLLRGKASMDALRQQLDLINETESHIMADHIEYLARVKKWSLAAFVAAGVFGLLLSAATVFLFSKEIVRRMGVLGENTRRLSEGMPLVPTPSRSDEIGRLERGMEAASRLLAAREQALFESQKMETVGKLAGGIAHEFNSILTVIIGQSELLLHELHRGHPLFKSASEIRKVAERAATLTRQLLASGRKQILQPEILDLNALLAGMERGWLHLFGPSVEVCTKSAVGLKSTKADAQQIKEVILNLAIRAAEAMPNGGKLTLETANVSFLPNTLGRDSDFRPGDYVMLAITDTGAGMTMEMQTHVFEPFYSTQGVGQATGLGLSAGYGIIKQSGGSIRVESEPDHGTTFKIYLPQVEKEATIAHPRPTSIAMPHGTETILLVEDNTALRETAALLLERLGYTVLVAAGGIEALNLKINPSVGRIDLLVSSVVMPQISGKELADHVQALYPHTRVLFTPGYTENSIVHQDVLTKGMALLQKPFTPSALAHKVREVLDQPEAMETDAPQKTFQFAESNRGPQ